MPDTGNVKDCHPQIFQFLFKKRDLTNVFDQFHSAVLFSISFYLYRTCFTHLISSNSSCNLCLWCFYQLLHLNKEIMQTYIVIVSGTTAKRFHCSFEWHLTPHMTLSIETCIRRTPCIKRTLQQSPEGVRLIQVSVYFN